MIGRAAKGPTRDINFNERLQFSHNEMNQANPQIEKLM
jgi:hypothetical protein